jgi:hypothetical protein
MQQRQLRLGDILDDYCPRERRLTNHAVVAMIGDEVKQTRCTTCDADHEYKHARVPRQRKKSEPAALLAPVGAVAPKKVAHESPMGSEPHESEVPAMQDGDHDARALMAEANLDLETATGGSVIDEDGAEDEAEGPVEEGPVHRPLIRAQLPRIEGQPPVPRQAPDFTIRQPGGGRPNRFRPRSQRGGGPPFQANRSNGNMPGNMGNSRGGAPPRQHGGRPPLMSHVAKRHGGGGRKRSK